MGQQKNDHKKIFDKEYFTNYYQAMTGNFADSDLQRNKNWFHGWFKALNSMYDFSNGKGKKVLEVGCAIGAAASVLHERGFKVTATDISPYAVKKAQKLLPDITCEVLDIEKLPKKFENAFDVIFSFEVIEHLEDPEKALRNMRAMLRKGGVVINSTPYPYGYVFIDSTHINVRHPLDWVRIYKKAGFKDVKYIQKGFIPFFYRFSKRFHFVIPFGINTPYINSPVFIYGKK